MAYAVYQPVGSTLRLADDADERSDRALVFIIYHLLHFTVQVQYINLTGPELRGRSWTRRSGMTSSK